MPITGRGWELHVERLGQHRKDGRQRTYGRYVVTIDGVPKPMLHGFMLEAIGPGDNSRENNGLRVEAGRYALTTHFRSFVSVGYSTNTDGEPPLPAIRLLHTVARTGILIHPAHPPADKLYLASVGCLNPVSALAPSESADFWDSRSRVIALLDSLRAFRPEAFVESVPTSIAEATIVIDGEPTAFLES